MTKNLKSPNSDDEVEEEENKCGGFYFRYLQIFHVND